MSPPKSPWRLTGKGSLARVLILATIFSGVGVAGAATYKRHLVFSVKDNGWVLVPTAPFQRFGNNVLGDCQYETAANLTLAEFPNTKITTSEVESAWREYGMALNGSLWEGQRFLELKGFGHRAEVTQISQGLDYAADHGGLEVTIFGQMEHMLGIIQAQGQNITAVDDGIIYHYSWAGFSQAYVGDTFAFYAIRWLT